MRKKKMRNSWVFQRWAAPTHVGLTRTHHSWRTRVPMCEYARACKSTKTLNIPYFLEIRPLSTLRRFWLFQGNFKKSDYYAALDVTPREFTSQYIAYWLVKSYQVQNGKSSKYCSLSWVNLEKIFLRRSWRYAALDDTPLKKVNDLVFMAGHNLEKIRYVWSEEV